MVNMSYEKSQKCPPYTLPINTRPITYYILRQECFMYLQVKENK